MRHLAMGIFDRLYLDVHPVRSAILSVVQDFGVKALTCAKLESHFNGHLRVSERSLQKRSGLQSAHLIERPASHAFKRCVHPLDVAILVG